MECWSTKAAISLKRVKIEKKLLYIYYEFVAYTRYDNKKANKELDMQTTTVYSNQCTNKQLVPVCQNQTNESSPTEQLVTLTEPAPYQHQPY